jgi:hypothetical protein
LVPQSVLCATIVGVAWYRTRETAARQSHENSAPRTPQIAYSMALSGASRNAGWASRMG